MDLGPRSSIIINYELIDQEGQILKLDLKMKVECMQKAGTEVHLPDCDLLKLSLRIV